MPAHPDPLDPDFAPETRSPSLWPETTRPMPLPHTGFGIDPAMSRFDPMADERLRERVHAAAAFDLCQPGLALRLMLVVQAVVAIGVLVALGQADWLRLQAAAGFAALVASLVWLALLCAGRGWLPLLAPAPRAALVLGLGAVCALGGVVPVAGLGLIDLRVPGYAGVALAGAGFAAVAWAWLDLRARLWPPAVTAARRSELQARILPQVLSEALGTAAALVRVDPERAALVLQDLDVLLREALAEPGAAVTLDEELDLVRRYLAIDQVRLGHRLQVRCELDPAAGRARVPSLVLLPLVDNAVRHGVEPAPAGGELRIQTAVRRGQAVVLVSNPLTEEPWRPGSGTPLAQVRERLRLLHDVAAQCDTWAEDAQFHARIVVPL